MPYVNQQWQIARSIVNPADCGVYSVSSRDSIAEPRREENLSSARQLHKSGIDPDIRVGETECSWTGRDSSPILAEDEPERDKFDGRTGALKRREESTQ